MKKVINILRIIIATPLLLLVLGVISIFVLLILLAVAVLYCLLGKELVDALNAKSDQRAQQEKLKFYFAEKNNK